VWEDASNRVDRDRIPGETLHRPNPTTVVKKPRHRRRHAQQRTGGTGRRRITVIHLCEVRRHLVIPRHAHDLLLNIHQLYTVASPVKLQPNLLYVYNRKLPSHHTTTVLWPFFRDHPAEPGPVENFWTLWCKGRLTEADTLTIQLSATPSGLTSAHLHQPPFFTGRMPFLPPNQQCQSTEGNRKLNC